MCCSAASTLLQDLRGALCLLQLASTRGRAQARGGALVAASAHAPLRSIMSSDTAPSSALCMGQMLPAISGRLTLQDLELCMQACLGMAAGAWHCEPERRLACCMQRLPQQSEPATIAVNIPVCSHGSRVQARSPEAHAQGFRSSQQGVFESAYQ